MMSGFSSFEVGAVSVATTENMGHDPDFWAEQATKRIVSIGGNCHPIIAQQAEAFKDAVQNNYVKDYLSNNEDTGNFDPAEFDADAPQNIPV